MYTRALSCVTLTCGPRLFAIPRKCVALGTYRFRHTLNPVTYRRRRSFVRFRYTDIHGHDILRGIFSSLKMYTGHFENKKQKND